MFEPTLMRLVLWMALNDRKRAQWRPRATAGWKLGRNEYWPHIAFWHSLV
jgi:hypothetical protein